MNKPDRANGPRRMVRKIVVTYVLEGDDTGEEHETILSARTGAAAVDGVIWSEALMKRLAYLDDGNGGRCAPVRRRPARPGDGWERRGRRGGEDVTDASVSAASAAADSGDEGGDCVWLHEETCTWISWCDTAL